MTAQRNFRLCTLTVSRGTGVEIISTLYFSVAAPHRKKKKKAQVVNNRIQKARTNKEAQNESIIFGLSHRDVNPAAT